MVTTTVTAPDIQCQGCADSIQSVLSRVPGVADVHVDVAAKSVTVMHDDSVADRVQIADALDAAGFPISER